MSAPIPVKNSGSSYNKPRRVSTSSRTTRRRSSSVIKEHASTWTASAAGPTAAAAPHSASSHKFRDTASAVSQQDDDSDEEADAPDGEVKGKVRGKRTKKGAEVFQCEKCAKWYRHPACLTKHRWQHTDYWQSTASLMMSKHQSVMMLEAAAILTNPGSLPDEKSLWPAAVSPPTSGLLGSRNINAEVIKSQRAASFGQAAAAGFGGGSGSSPAFNSFSSFAPIEHMHHSSDETEDTSPDSALDDFEPTSSNRRNHASTTRDTSPADDNAMDEEEMFALDMGDLKVVEEEPEQPSSSQPQGLPQRLEMPPMQSSQQRRHGLPFSARWDASPSSHNVRLPYAEMGISAPSMGFFEPRRGAFGLSPPPMSTGRPFDGPNPPLPLAQDRSSAQWAA